METEQEMIGPLNFNERTVHSLKEGCSEVEQELKELKEYATGNKMKIN